jgi:hypothetical protein
MVLDPKQAASTRRIAFRALFLAAPLLIAGLAIPRVLPRLAAARQAAVPATPGSPMAPSEAAPPAPRAPEAPSPEQLERSVATARALGEAERGWRKVEILSPAAPAAPGVEQTAPFQGFGLSLESEPDGATVTVDGRVLGETPLLTGLPCTPGSSLRLRVARDPLPARELTTLCRADTLVKLRVRLGP